MVSDSGTDSGRTSGGATGTAYVAPDWLEDRLTAAAELPALWGYARDLFSIPAFGDNTDFDQIKQHYYVVQSDLNPSGIVPKGPDLDAWWSSHGRGRLARAA